MALGKKLFLAALLCSNAFSALAAQDLIVWDRLKDNPVAYQILELALDKTTLTHGDYRLVSSQKMEQERAVIQLQRHESLDIANFAPSPEREKKLLPIRLPVTQGLLGYRVCLIRKGDQKKFDDIDNLQGWQSRDIKIGQGKGWPDVSVLEANGLSVVKSVKYQTLFPMLRKGRFDCFSRSISEVMPELQKHPEFELEKNLLLVYRLPTFFFVSLKTPELAERIEKGLNLAYQDGSIAQLISAYYQSDFDAMDVGNRVEIHLQNPYLTDKTKAALSQFNHWLDIKGYQ